MPDNLILNVRQIAQYAARTAVDPTDLILLQAGGLGGPYYSATPPDLFAQLNLGGPLGVGIVPPADSLTAQIFTDEYVMPRDGDIFWNAYADPSFGVHYFANGPAAWINVDPSAGLSFYWAPPGTTDALVGNIPVLFNIHPTGSVLSSNTLTVARDPTAPLEVVTLQYLTKGTSVPTAPLAWGVGPPPADAVSPQVISGGLSLRMNDGVVFNAYSTGSGQSYLMSGPAGNLTMANDGTFYLKTAPSGSPSAAIPWQILLTLSPAGHLTLLDTVTVGRDPTAPLEVATKGYVDNHSVASFNGRTGAVTFTVADFNAATVVGTPTAPTAAPGTSTTQLATTAYVTAAIAALPTEVTSWNGRTGAVTLSAADITGAGGALLASPNFSGVPTAPTANPGTSTGQLATTAYVVAAVAAATTGVSSFNTRTGAVTLSQSDIVNASGWASPSFTGVPLAPTAATATNTTQIATTAFVHAAITAAPGVTSFNTRTGAVVLTTADVTGAGGAPLAAPAFTGVPTANTAAPGTNTTQLATTAFVAAALAAISTGVTSFNSRTGPVVLQGNDVSAAGGALIASPAFTGNPTAPTATTGDQSASLATTLFVAEAIAANISGVSTWNGRAGAVTMVVGDITGAGGAPIASPTFTGVPAAPTAATATSTTQLATTAFVHAAITALPANVASFNGRTGAVTLTAADITAVGGAVGSFLPLAGGNLTGNLGIVAASPLFNLSKSSGASGTCDIYAQTAGLPRWLLRFGTTAETGGNLGSDLNLYRFNDAGAVIDAPLSVRRADGQIAFGKLTNAAYGGAPGNIQAVMICGTAHGIVYSANVNTAGGGSFPAIFNNTSGSQVGYILISDAATGYATSSDMRLKEAINPFTGGRAILDRIAVKDFVWKQQNQPGIGVIAQECRDSYPDAIAVGEGEPGDDSFRPWGVDYSKYVPLLIEALQHAHRRIDELEARMPA